MRVENVSLHRSASRARIEARFVWEEWDEEPFDAFLEADGEASADLDVSADALLLAVLPLALHRRQRRISMEGSADSRLLENLAGVQEILRTWYGYTPLAIELSGTAAERKRPPRSKTVSFSSGGVDACHLLWANRRDYRRSHPRAVDECIHVAGLAYQGDVSGPAAASLHERSMRSVCAIAADAAIPVTLVHSNLKAAATRYHIFGQACESAFFSAVVHSFAGRYGRALIASSYSDDHLIPYGTHPLVTPLYSSAAIELELCGAHLTRARKIAEVSLWPAALRNLQVCFEGPTPKESLNCGECEKCVRTMIGLLLAGKLSETAAFPGNKIRADDIARIGLGYDDDAFVMLWKPFEQPLVRAGRGDLARAVSKRLAQIEQARRWRADSGPKGLLRRADRALLGGRMTRWSRKWRGLVPGDTA